MIPLGEIIAEVEGILRKSGGAGRESICRSINLVVADMVAQHPFAAFRRKTQVDFADRDTTDDSMVLPSPLCNVLSIWDEVNGIEYHQGGAGATSGDVRTQVWDARYRWYYSQPVITPILNAKEVGITPGSATFTLSSTTFLAAWIGEYAQFGSEPSLYELTADKTIESGFNGKENLTAGWVKIRPAGTRRFSIVDNTNVASGSIVQVHWWRRPIGYWRDEDLIPLPMSRAIELATAIKVLGEKDRKRLSAQDWQVEYQTRWGEMLSADPPLHFPRHSQDATGVESVWR
mgnify:CR=1 FL=1|jgi:hypothetical protein